MSRWQVRSRRIPTCRSRCSASSCGTGRTPAFLTASPMTLAKVPAIRHLTQSLSHDGASGSGRSNGSTFATLLGIVVLVVPFVLERLHQLARPIVPARGVVVIQVVHRLAQGPVR